MSSWPGWRRAILQVVNDGYWLCVIARSSPDGERRSNLVYWGNGFASPSPPYGGPLAMTRGSFPSFTTWSTTRCKWAHCSAVDRIGLPSRMGEGRGDTDAHGPTRTHTEVVSPHVERADKTRSDAAPRSSTVLGCVRCEAGSRFSLAGGPRDFPFSLQEKRGLAPHFSCQRSPFGTAPCEMRCRSPVLRKTGKANQWASQARDAAAG